MRRAFRYFLISILSIVFTLIAVGVIYIVADTHSRIQLQDNKETYSTEEVEELMSEAKAEGRKGVLDSIKESLENGNTVISVLKSLYPEYIVVAANSKYNFVEINDELAKNNFNIDNLSEDELGRYVYSSDGELTSRFGIDVSSHQGDIDWEAVKAEGVEFVFVRAVYRGYGTGKLVVDEKCLQNIEGAQAVGIDVGVYVFSQAISQAEVLEEASTVIGLLDGYTLQLPIVFDVEKVADSSARTNALTVQERTDLTKAFLEAVKNAGYQPMFYHNTEMGAMLLDLTQLTEYPKWFAGYNREFYWPYEYDIWQYSETGRVNGINGNVDLDIWLQ
ncbi:MAG: lysozyme [Pseudobutyrivibrio sp.]|uniref:glycoside hydrolase family 25 protein n=1 Tax=Pseudobutyrivibrio sp. TaxID=2014367 RepID=UPI001B256DEC|nr:GH25 family lysozyme [Pseudobutyrivibrio sp.]MBO5617793.1 lysozyme [Pseudobutyrivibrio sp.]MBO6284494.1 lysozyme [Pseudobutyrivibrio sp.]MBP3262090.1 lysozyme [Pseudobutyrivibrio sp.]